jgi:hypothetical protein
MADNSVQDKLEIETANYSPKEAAAKTKEVEETEEPLAENLSNLDLNDLSDENGTDDREDNIKMTTAEEAQTNQPDMQEAPTPIKEDAPKDEAEKKGSFFDRHS